MMNLFHTLLGKIFPNNLSSLRLPKALISFILSIIISISMLTVLCLITYNNFREMNQRTKDVTHSYQVRFKNNELINQLINAETGQRGFLLTGDESFLKPYTDNKAKLPVTVQELKILLKDRPEQVKRVDTIANILETRLDIVIKNIAHTRNHKKIDTLSLYLGKVYMDKIRKASIHIDEQEEQLLNHRHKLQEISDTRMAYYLLGLSVVSLIFLIIFFRLLYLELKQRISLQNTLEQKLVEIEHTNAELEQFAYITSHDLQEPLRKIRAFGERLYSKQGHQLSEDAKTNIMKINHSASRMQLLINDLLTFSRITNVKDYVFEKVDLNSILDEVKDDFSEIIGQKKAYIDSQPLPKVKGIRLQLVQLFSNLISNSLKYVEPNVSPHITIRYKQVLGSEISEINDAHKDNVYHKVTFIDNGIGFDEKYTEKIFAIFQRLHNKNEYEGTGIGLAICKRIIVNHNGYILAESKKGYLGAIFHIYIPIRTLAYNEQERNNYNL
jgi:signal transduction histidine kinase